MATAVVMPKQGQSVESCLIVSWKKKVGEQVAVGDVLCEVETDKALLEVESPAAGTLLAHFFAEGDEVPVLMNIAAIGEPDESVDDLRPDTAPATPPQSAAGTNRPEPSSAKATNGPAQREADPQVAAVPEPPGHQAISPRARNLAQRKAMDLAGVEGTGPGGRIIERDVQAALTAQPRLTPLAKSMLAGGGFEVPIQSAGARSRVTSGDLVATADRGGASAEAQSPAKAPPDEVQTIALKGVRKVIAGRMLESLQSTAQLTLNASADARALRAYRARLKLTAESLGLRQVTLNDLILFAVSRILPHHPALNALFDGTTISQYRPVHLGFAVDTPRGLMVPVIRRADSLSLKQMAQESRRLAAACLEGTITPDALSGGTFTVSNLGSFGIESFTPVLNPPQVAILGVGNVNLKPVEGKDEVEFVPHLGLSLTIDHQVVDGAPAARFLQALAQGLAEFEMLLAL